MPISSDNLLNPHDDTSNDGWTTDTGGTTNLYAAIDENTLSGTSIHSNVTDVVQANGNGFGTTATVRLGQSVVIPHGFVVVSSIVVKLRRVSSPADGVRCLLKETLTGPVLGTSDTVAGSTIGPNGFTSCTFTFSGGTAVPSSCVFVLERTGALDDTNFYTFQQNPGTSYPAGVLSTENGSGVWSGTAYDFGFSIDYSWNADGDFIQSPVGPATSVYETALEGIADPNSSTGHVVRYRYRKSVAADVVDLTTEFVHSSSSSQLLTSDQSGFEVSLGGWTGSGGLVERSTAQAHQGSASMLITPTEGWTNTTARLLDMAVVAGRTYAASAWVRAVVNGVSTKIQLQFLNGAGAQIGLTQGTAVTDVDTGWTEISVSNALAPTGAAKLVFHIQFANVTTGEGHYIDTVTLSANAFSIPWTHTNVGAIFTTADQTLTAAQADSITDYNNLLLRFTANTTNNTTAPTLVADRATLNSNAAATTFDHVLTGLTVDNWLIIRTAADNSGGGGAARSITVTNQTGTAVDTAGALLYQQNNDPGAASAGTTLNVIIAKITATSGTVRVTYSGSVIQASVAAEWSGLPTANPVVGTPVGANAVNTTALASMTDASVAAKNLAYGAIAIEGPSGDTFTQDTDTTGGSWSSTTKVGTTLATATDNQTIVGGYKIPTVTGEQIYNPSNNVARDSAGLLLEIAQGPATARSQVSWAQFEVPAAVGVNYSETKTDPLGLLDAAVPVSTTGVSITDALGLVDNATPERGFARDVTDSHGLLDTAESLVTQQQSHTDTVGLLDSANQTTDYIKTQTSTVGLADSVSQVGTLADNRTDALGLLDSTVQVGSFSAISSDVLGTTDVVQHNIVASPSVTSSLALNDQLSIDRTIALSSDDVLPLSDSTGSSAVTYNRTVRRMVVTH